MQLNARVLGQPLLDRRVLVGAVVVTHHLQRHPWVGAGELAEEGQELLVAVPLVAGVGDLPGGHVQRRKQRRGAVSDVVVAALFRQPRSQRQDRRGPIEGLDHELAGCEVVGFDETGLRVDGKLHWVHCARTGKYTLVSCHPRRGRAGIDELGVLGRFCGVAVHDAWAPYDTYPDVAHQLCCAHVLPELHGVVDGAPASAWCWAGQAADAVVAMQKLVAEAIEAGRDAVDANALADQVSRYRSAALIGINETAPRAGTLMKKHNALAHRLIDRQNDYLRFTTDWRVTADNNGAERDIRMIKLRQKVSGCLRTLIGARQFCAIRSYLSTAGKHGMNFFEALVMLTEGNPWMPAPS